MIQLIAIRDCLPRGGDEPDHGFYSFLKTCLIKEGTWCVGEDRSECLARFIVSPAFDVGSKVRLPNGGLYYNDKDFREPTNVEKLIEFNRRKNEHHDKD